MKMLSLKLREDVLSEVDKTVRLIHMSRNAYINQALEFFNKVNRRKLLRRQLMKESKAVGGLSMEVLEELERVDDDLLP